MTVNEKSKLANRITDAYVAASAINVWIGQLEKAEKITKKALEIVDLAYGRNSLFFGGKSEKRIIGGLFYCLGLSLGYFRTQRQIALGLGTTEITVRASSRDWQNQFPDLVKCEPSQSTHFPSERH